MLAPDPRNPSDAPPTNCLLIDDEADVIEALTRVGADPAMRSWVQHLACYLRADDDVATVISLAAELPNLEMVELDGTTHLSATALTGLASCPALIALALPGDAIAPEDCAALAGLRLRVLRVWAAHDAILLAASKMRTLLALDISSDECDVASILAAARQQALRYLSLEMPEGCFGREVVLELVRIPHLDHFFFSGTFEESVLDEIAGSSSDISVSRGPRDASGMCAAFVQRPPPPTE